MPPVLLTLKKKPKISSANDLAKVAAPKVTQFLYNIIRVGPRIILRSTFELLRANAVTRILSAIVLISIDTVGLFKKRISFKQYMINLVLALTLMVGGTAGWYLGGYVVGIILLENVVLGIIVSLLGAGVLGAGLALGWEWIVKTFMKDDTTCMMEICNQVFNSLIIKYELSRQEAESAKDLIYLDAAILQTMFAQKDQENREEFAMQIIEPKVMEAVGGRMKGIDQHKT